MSTQPNKHDQLATGLAKLGLVIRQHAWASGEHTGLTPTQGQVLATLLARGGAGMSVSALARELAVTQPTVSDAIAALHRKKLVTKAPSETDARVVLVSLSAAGARAASSGAQWPDQLLAAIDVLDEHERGVFVRGLLKMIHALVESGQIPVSRMCTSCVHFRPHAHAGKDRPHHCALVNAPLGESNLRVDCREHEGVAPDHRPKLWQLFIRGEPASGPPTSLSG